MKSPNVRKIQSIKLEESTTTPTMQTFHRPRHLEIPSRTTHSNTSINLALNAISQPFRPAEGPCLRPQPSNCQPAPKEGNLTNCILCMQYSDFFSFILPVYIRFRYEDTIGIDFQTLTATVNGVIVITVLYGDLPPELTSTLLTSVYLSVGKRMNLNLDNQQFIENMNTSLKIVNRQDKRQLTYIIRGSFESEIESKVWCAPFQEIKINFYVKLTSYECTFLGKPAKINFNVMGRMKNDELDIQKMLNAKTNNRNREYMLDTGKYSMRLIVEPGKEEQKKQAKAPPAESQSPFPKGRSKRNSRYLIDTENGCHERSEMLESVDDPKKKIQEIRKFLGLYKIPLDEIFFMDELREEKSFQKGTLGFWNTAQFTLPLIKNPLYSFITIIIPVAFLSLVNIAIFFQGNDFSAKISAIATMLIAYTTLLPTVRERMPRTPTITLIDLMLYSVILMSLMVLVRGFIDRNKNQEYHYLFLEDPFFFIGIAGYAIISGILIILLIHNLIKIPQLPVIEKFKQRDATQGDFQNWKNPAVQTQYKKNDVFKQFQHYGTKFFQSHQIFFRLWIQRFEKEVSEHMPELRDKINEGPVPVDPTDLLASEHDQEQLYTYKDIELVATSRKIHRRAIERYKNLWDNRYDLSPYYRRVFPYLFHYYLSFSKLSQAVHMTLNLYQLKGSKSIQELPEYSFLQDNIEYLTNNIRNIVSTYIDAKILLMEGCRRITDLSHKHMEFEIKYLKYDRRDRKDRKQQK